MMTGETIAVRCHGALNDFLPRSRRGAPLTLRWSEHETVKHVVEATGVPHPEVAALLVNGTSVMGW